MVALFVFAPKSNSTRSSSIYMLSKFVLSTNSNGFAQSVSVRWIGFWPNKVYTKVTVKPRKRRDFLVLIYYASVIVGKSPHNLFRRKKWRKKGEKMPYQRQTHIVRPYPLLSVCKGAKNPTTWCRQMYEYRMYNLQIRLKNIVSKTQLFKFRFLTSA